MSQRKKAAPKSRTRKPLPLRLEHLEDRAVPTAYEVSIEGNFFLTDGQITLAEALRAAVTNTATNDAPAGSATGPDVITFASGVTDIHIGFLLDEIGPGSGPLSVLGPATGSLTLDGQGVAADGLVVNGQTGVVIRDLILTGFTDAAVRVTGGGSVSVTGCDILVNGGYGVLLDGAKNCTIGGTDADSGNGIQANGIDGVRITGGATGNVIAGNYISLNGDADGAGVHLLGGVTGNLIGLAKAGGGNVIIDSEDQGVLIEGPGTSGNAVLGNWIGIDRAGTVHSNGAAGVEVSGGATRTQIGGTAPGARNIIGGNAGAGVQVVGETTTGTEVLGNYIGTFDGREARLNAYGVAIIGASQTVVGGVSAAAGNVISGNLANGVFISAFGAVSNTVAGNRIGTTADGTAAMPNGQAGVRVFGGASGNLIGLGVAGGGNLISGNGGQGVWIDGTGTAGNAILGNRIGLDVNGGALGNGAAGVDVSGGATRTLIGGQDGGQRNVIGGNAGDGVRVAGVGTSGTLVFGNYVGTDPTGKEARPNQVGVHISGGATQALVGGNSDQGFGNLISGNSSRGVRIEGAGTALNIVAGNRIGTTADGTAALPNGLSGVDVLGGATNNLVGLATAHGGNVIAGNGGAGVYIIGEGASGNAVFGNRIGLDVNGNALANDGPGISVGDKATDNRIGGTGSGERNVIGGNAGAGVQVSGVGTAGNSIAGNLIGTDPTGTQARPNAVGVVIERGAANNRVGLGEPGGGNVIAGNTKQGVLITGAGTAGNAVVGNFIGLDVNGQALANAAGGIEVSGQATGTRIGGAGTGERNVIGGNKFFGVSVSGAGTAGTVIAGNYVGTDPTGTQARSNGMGVTIDGGATQALVGGRSDQGFGNLISGNEELGVRIFGGGENTIAGNRIGTTADGAAGLGVQDFGIALGETAGNVIGGAGPGLGNVISGNVEFGVFIGGLAPGGTTSTGNRLEGNRIGTDATGTAAVPNLGGGVWIDAGASLNTVGGLTPAPGTGPGNVIAGNGGDGVRVVNQSADNTVAGNLIGLGADGRPLGNAGRGVYLADGATGNVIGGDAPARANRIAHNAAAGVEVSGDATRGNRVLGSAIFANGAPGIDLGGDGVTANDPGDADASPNGLQNFPVLTAVAGSAGITSASGSLNSLANTAFRVEFFANTRPGGPDGEAYLGFVDVTTDGAGNATINVPNLAALPAGTLSVTATATNLATGDTSEFSAAFAINTPPTVTDITDRTVPAGGSTGPLAFTVGDAQTAPDQLQVTVSTSDPTLVPLSGIVFGGSDADRTVTVTPAAGLTGTATVTLTVTDAGGATVTVTFTVTVVSELPPPPPPPSPPPPPPPPAPPGLQRFTVGAGAGGAPTVIHSAGDGSPAFSLTPFEAAFTGGVRVATGDFNGDGVADVAAGTGPGRATRVVVLDGVTKAELFAIDPFEASFTGGVYVAAGDLTGDGLADLVITPDEGGGPRVRIFNGGDFKQLADFFGIDDPNFRGGARAAVADVTGDGVGDLLVAAGFGGGPRLAAFDGKSLAGAPTKPFGDFFVFESTLRNGVFVAGGDIDGDGYAEVIAGGGPGGGPRVFALSGAGLLASRQDVRANFFAGDTNNRGGVRIAARDLDGDGHADLTAGSGTGAGSRVTGYSGRGTVAGGTPPELFAFDALPGFAGGVFVG